MNYWMQCKQGYTGPLMDPMLRLPVTRMPLKSFMVILYKSLCMPTESGWSQCHGSHATRHMYNDTQCKVLELMDLIQLYMVNSLWDQCY